MWVMKRIGFEIRGGILNEANQDTKECIQSCILFTCQERNWMEHKIELPIKHMTSFNYHLVTYAGNRKDRF